MVIIILMEIGIYFPDGTRVESGYWYTTSYQAEQVDYDLQVVYITVGFQLKPYIMTVTYQ